MIKATYYLIEETVHLAVDGVLLCTIAAPRPTNVTCGECGHEKYQRIYRDEARARFKCGDCLRVYADIRNTEGFIDSLPVVPHK